MLRTLSSLLLAAFVTSSALAAKTDTTPPSLLSAVVSGDGSVLTLNYEEENLLDPSSAAPVNNFIISTTDSGAITVTAVSVNVDNTMTLTLSDPVSIGDTVTIGSSSSPVSDDSANAAPVLSAEPVITSAVNYSSSSWVSIQPSGGSQFDYFVDQQTGQSDSDLVGDGQDNPGVQVHFDDAGNASNTDGTLSFRFRLAKEGSNYYFAGVDGDLDGAIDVFIGVDNSQNIIIYNNDGGANVSPSTTGIDGNTQNPPYEASPTEQNFNLSTVTSLDGAVVDPDLDGNGDPDVYVSAGLPFNALVSALNTVGVVITDQSVLRYAIASATQSNAFNQDIAGLPKDYDASASYVSSGAFSDPVTLDGSVIVPGGAPVINDLSGDTLAYVMNDGPTIIDRSIAATVSDSDDSSLEDFGGLLPGSLRVEITAGAEVAEDALGIFEGAVNGSTLSLSAGYTVGSVVSVDGVAIGTISDIGAGTDPVNDPEISFTVTFDQLAGSATLVRVGALMQAVTYVNSNTTTAVESTRTVGFLVSDGSLNARVDTSVIVAQVADMTAPLAPTVDLLAVSDSGPSNSDDITNVTTPVIRVTFDQSGVIATDTIAGDVVELYESAVLVGSATVTATDVSNGYIDITSSALTEGGLGFTAKVTDASGNASPASSVLPVSLITSSPSVDIQNEPADINASVFSVTFKFNRNVTGFISSDIAVGNATVSNFSGTGDTYTADITPTGGNITIDVNAAVALDIAGNDNSAALQANVTYDVTAPSVNIDAPSAANAVNAGSYDVTGSCTSGDDSVTVAITGASPASQAVSCTADVFTVSFDVSGITDGVNALDISASQADTAGNTGADTAQANKDVVAPVISINAPDANSTNQLVYPVSGICASGEGNVTVSVTGASPASKSVNCSTGLWSTSFDVSGISDGLNAISISVSQTDPASNTGNASSQADKDTAAPSVSLDAPVDANSSNEASYDVTGSCTSGDSSVTVAITGASPASQTVSCTADVFTVSFDVSGITDGVNALNISASQTDTVGNAANDSAQADKDATVPAVSINTPVVATTSNEGSYGVSGSCTYGDGDVTVAITGASPVSRAVSCTTNAFSATFDVSGITDGINALNISASQTDAAGNTGNDTAQADKDTTAPVVALNAPADATLSNQASYSVGGSCESAEGNVTVAIAGASPASQAVSCTANAFSASFDVSGIADGVNALSISASQADAGGNTGSDSAQADKDAAAPVVTLDAPADATLSNQASYSVGGSCESAEGNVTVAIVGASPASQAVSCTTDAFTASFDVSGITDGANALNISASQTDAAGNTGNDTAQADKDTTAPVVALNAPTDATLSNQASYSVGGSCESAEGNVTVTIIGASPASQAVSCTANAFSASFDVSAIADGVNALSISASQDDAGGNTGSDSAQADKDSAAPVVTLNAPADATLSNQASYSVGGSCESAEGNVTVAIVGASPASQAVSCTANAFSASFDVSAITDGVNVLNIAASQTDAAGNVGSDSAQADKDAAAPAVSVDGPSDVNSANEATYNVAGSCTSGEGDVTVAITGATPASQAVSCTTNAFSAMFDVSGISDGTNALVISASQTDAAGNVGSDSAQADKDATVPAVSINTPVVATTSNEGSYGVSGSCTSGDGDVTVAITGATPASQAVSCTTNAFSASFDVSGITDGINALNISASQTDSVGNTGNDSAQADKDATVPAVSINAPVVATTSNEGSYGVSGSCTSGDGDVTVAITGATPASQAVNCTANAFSASFDVSGITDGASALSISASQTDAVGNAGSDSAQAVKDTTAPVISIDAPADATTANESNYSVSGSCESAEGNVTVAISGASPASTSVSCTANAFSASFDVSGIPDGGGVLNISASQVDSAGNIGNDTAQADKDSAVPAVSLDAPVDANSGNETSYDVTGSCTSGDGSVTVAIAGATPVSQAVSCTTDAFTASFDVSGITDGANALAISASQTDAAGNTGSDSAQADKDASAPVVSIDAPVVATASNEGSYGVSGSCASSGGSVTVAIAGATPASQAVSCTTDAFNASFDVSGITDGTNALAISASQTDAAGNTGSDSAQADKDATVPAVSINAPVVATTSNEGSYGVSGSCTSGDGDVTVVITGATPASQAVSCTANAFSATFDVSGITDAANALNISSSQTDGVGNISNDVAQADKDATAPVVSINAPVDATSGNESGYSVSGSCESAEGNVTVAITGASPDSTSVSCTANAFSASFDVSGITDGSGVLSISTSQVDGVGNVGNDTTQADKDSTAPAVSLDALANANAFNEAVYSVNGSCTSGDGGVTVAITGATPASTSVSCTTDTFSASFDVSGIADGVDALDISASQMDGAGNTGSDTVQADKDASAPAVSIDLPGNANTGNENSYDVTGSCTSGDGSVSVAIAGATPASTSVSCVADAFSASFDVSAITDGVDVLSISVSQTDSAGNTGSDTAQASKDATAPLVSIDAPADANTSNESSYNVSGSCASGDGLVTVAITGATPASQAVSCTADVFTASFDVSGITDGADALNIAASQTDGAGNTGNDSAQAAVDTTAPIVSLDDPVDANTANDAAYSVTGSCTSGDGNVTVAITGASPASISVSCTTDIFTAGFDVSGITDGGNVLSISASQTDAAGNTGNDSAQADKDASAPTVSLDAPADVNTSNQASYGVSGSCVTGEGDVTVTITGASPASANVSCTTDIFSASFDVSGVTDGVGALSISASQTDAAGNTGSDSAQADKDATAPAVSIDVPSDANAANEAAYRVTGSCETAEGDVTIAITGASPASTSVSCTGNLFSASFDVSGITDGSNALDISASQADSAGNTGSDNNQADKDATAPVVIIDAPVIANLANENSYGVTGSCETAEGNVTIAITGASPLSTSVSCTGNAFSASFDISGVTDGVDALSINASQTDSASNTGSDTAQADKDSVAPSVSIAAPDAVNSANASNYAIDGSCSTGDGDVTVAISSALPASQSVACNAGNWSASFDVSGIGDGSNALAISVSQTDSAGNAANDSAQADKDTVLPVVAIDAPATANSANVNSYGVSGSCLASDGNVTVLISGASPVSQSVSCNAGSWSASFDVSLLGDGNNVLNISASQTDASGNTGGDTAQADKDATRPSADIQGEPLSSAQIAFGITIAFSEDVSGFGSTDITVNNGTVTGFAGINASNYSVQITPNGNGDITIDIAGNVAQDSVGNGNTAAVQAVVALVEDSDADGIPDSIECPSGPPFDAGCADADNDTVPDYLESDSDNDGISDITEAGPDSANPIDSDGDGIPDYRDTDSDNDGIDDLVETTIDTDGDGIPDYVDTGVDSDGDGIPDTLECTTYPGCEDTDGDGTPDYLDTDSDNDGIDDAVEAGTDPVQPLDTDGDGTPDYRDTDSDNDAVDDATEGMTDTDGDGVPDYVDVFSAGPGTGDSDGDGIADEVECEMYPLCADSDGDGTPDYMETDSDNDGILDSVETGSSSNDTDNDGINDSFDADQTGGLDLNNDGIDDRLPLDTDGDGAPDYQDTDSDNDGIDDVTEGMGDADNDGIPDYLDASDGDASGSDITGSGDSDGDGVSDGVECPASIPCPDSDGDGIPDYMDALDIDGPLADPDNDGLLNHLDPDDDNDRIPDVVEDSNFDTDDNPASNALDSDLDGIPDFIDTDSDNDGIDDATESGASGNDADGDNIDDSYDIDVTSGSDGNGDGIDDAVEPLDSDADGLPDYIDLVNDASGGDSDGDGIPNAEECPDFPSSCPDSDGDGTPDYLEADSDNDGLLDHDETGSLTSGVILDTDGDGKPDYQDTDSDNDGLSDTDEGLDVDSDNDGIPDALDADSSGAVYGGDSDGDGVEDAAECPNYPACTDSDNDGTPDYMDPSVSPYNPNEVIDTGLNGVGGNGPWTILAMLSLLMARRFKKQ